jgi:hypothetical protein
LQQSTVKPERPIDMSGQFITLSFTDKPAWRAPHVEPVSPWLAFSSSTV